jgi:hypothetical protein
VDPGFVGFLKWGVGMGWYENHLATAGTDVAPVEPGV